MHQPIGSHHIATIDLPDRLVAKAHPENRRGGTQLANQLAGNSRFFRRAWAGGNTDARWLERFDIRHREGVIAENRHLFPQFAKVLYEVVGE